MIDIGYIIGTVLRRMAGIKQRTEYYELVQLLHSGWLMEPGKIKEEK